MENCFLTTVLNIRKAIFTVILVAFGIAAQAQVTTSSISGIVKDKKSGETLIGASVIATHVPSGTRYASITNEDGKYSMPAVRVGGPYKVVVTYVGYKESFQENIYSALGTSANVNFTVSEDATVMEEVVITSDKNDVFSSNRTGAATTVNSSQLSVLPTIGARTLNDFTKYNAQGNGRNFGGQDARLNNITIDGSVFNNGFGLGGSAIAGGRTGTTAVSLDAIEEIQVNVAPFDIRQSGFVGAGINAVTRSGSNDFSGSAYTFLRNESFIGKKARNVPVTVNKFNENIYGFRLGGPIIKNKLFFFANAELQRRTDPGTLYGPSDATNAIPTRVLRNDLQTLSDFMKTNFGYETGAFENFDYKTKSDKFLVRLDYNISDYNKLNVRYSHHDSESDFPISNSAALGNGNRGNLSTGLSMAYENAGYLLQDNTRSIVAELNSTFGSKSSNTFIASYNYQNEDRNYKNRSSTFPTIDIRNGIGDNTNYISLGFDPFTPSNRLNYTTMQLTDNYRMYLKNNTITIGASYERFKSENVFFPGSNGAYVFQSLQDFYTIAGATKANPSDTIKGNPLARFQLRYSALPGAAEPVQPLIANTISVYVQDEIQVTPKLNVTVGVRASRINFGNTGYENPAVPALTFNNPETQPVTGLKTGVLPDPQILFEPRLGFNLDVKGDKTLQVRGGTGIFTGRPPFVWISNQVGNNGVLTGLIDQSNIRSIRDNKGNLVNPFQIDNITSLNPSSAALPPTYEINVTDSKYRYPQVWKTNVAIDQKLPYGFVASLEGLYNANINQAVFYDYNLKTPNADQILAGPDSRPNYRAFSANPAVAASADTRINSSIINAYVMGSTNQGYNVTLTAKIEKTLNKDWGMMMAYTYSRTRDIMSGASTAFSSFTGGGNTGNPNRLPLAISDFEIPHRVIGYASYKLGYGGTGVFGGDFIMTLGFEATQSARYSYTYGGDLNGDGINNNDLLYVPTADDLKSGRFAFASNTVGALNTTFTSAQQAAAYEAFIQQDEYLNARRGQLTERNGAILPWLTQLDLNLTKNFNILVGGKKNTLQLNFNVLNLGNLINSNWGVGQRVTGRQPVSFAFLAEDKKTPVYRMNTQSVTNPDGSSSTFLVRDTYVNNNTINNVYSMQLGLRYIFN
jgi:hypothetical protein